MKSSKKFSDKYPSISLSYSNPMSQASPPSTMRLMAGGSLVVGAIIAIIGLLRNEDLSELAVLCSVFVGPAFIGKAAQKHIELRSGSRK